MDYKEGKVLEKGIALKGVKHFHPQQIFECGQCFRWTSLSEEKDHYLGVVAGKVVEVKLVEDEVVLLGITEEEFHVFFKDYFDLSRDYGKVKRILRKDPLLKKAVAFGYGIRILKQDPFETLISFILSSNNLIPKIREGIRRISELYGEPILYEGETYYAFPAPEALSRATEEELRGIGLGYRAAYIEKTAKLVYEASLLREEKEKRVLSTREKELILYDLTYISELPEEECLKALMRYPGVGMKVADCVMLFSMGKTGAFPVDVWVKKAMVHFYGAEPKSLPKMRSFAKEKFGDLAGFSQQYLFYYAREKKIRIPEEKKQK